MVQRHPTLPPQREGTRFRRVLQQCDGILVRRDGSTVNEDDGIPRVDPSGFPCGARI